jgi:hypothetical protein
MSGNGKKDADPKKGAPADLEAVQKSIVERLKGLKGTDAVPGTYPEFFRAPIIRFAASKTYVLAIENAEVMVTKDKDGAVTVDPLAVGKFHNSVDEFRRALKQYLNRTKEYIPTDPYRSMAAVEWPGDDVAQKILVELEAIKTDANKIPEFREEPKTLYLHELDTYIDPKEKRRNAEKEWKKAPETNTPIDNPGAIPQHIARRLDRIWFVMDHRGLDVKYDDDIKAHLPLYIKLYGDRRSKNPGDHTRGAWQVLDDMLVKGEDGELKKVNGEFVPVPDFKAKLKEFNDFIDQAKESAGFIPDKIGQDKEGQRRAEAVLIELRQLQEDANSAAKRFKIAALVDPVEFPKLAMGDTAKPAETLEEIAAGARFNVVHVERAASVSTTVGAVQRTGKSGTLDLA